MFFGKTNFKKNGSEVTQKEIIEFEETNTGVIRLYLEGSFYKAYERSAFAFCTRIKDYKVLRKESKTLGRQNEERRLLESQPMVLHVLSIDEHMNYKSFKIA